MELILLSNLLLLISSFSLALRSSSSIQLSHFETQNVTTDTHLNAATCFAWYHYDVASHTCQCLPIWLVTCKEESVYVYVGHLVTYNADLNLISVYSPIRYPSWNKFYNVTTLENRSVVVLLPNNLSEVNDYMCRPFNRRGYMCSECMHGYGPSMIPRQLSDTCYACDDNWSGVVKYLSWTFIPITVFYLIVTVLRLKFASAPMTCFVMYCQLVVLTFSKSHYEYLLYKIEYQGSDTTRIVTKTFLTLYGV